MYGSSPKVKFREGMCGASQLIAELQIQVQVLELGGAHCNELRLV